MKNTNKWMTVAILTIGLTVGSLNAALTSVTNNSSADASDVYLLSTGDLANGKNVFIDRTYTVNSLPSEMEGMDYILTANDDKTDSDVTIDVTFDTPTTFYLSIDNRVDDDNSGTPPNPDKSMSWVTDHGWEQTTLSWNMGVDTFTVYTLLRLSDSYTFHPQLQYGGGGRNMYSIAAKPYSGDLSVTNYHYATIDFGPKGQRVAAGATGLPGATNNNVNVSAYGPTEIGNDKFDLTLNEVDWQDKGNSTNTANLVRIGEDFVKNDAGTVTMTLSNLYAGHYSATSYHVDANSSQSPRIQVFVSDIVSNERLQTTHADSWLSIGGVNNLTPSNILRTATSFEFWANGTDPVILRFNGTPGRSNGGKFVTSLNGIDLVLNTTLKPITLTPFALIDVGPNGQRVVTNGIGLAGAPANNANTSNYESTALTADDGSSFTFKIDSLNTNGVATGGIDWRDRGDSILTNELSQLAEDQVKNNSGIVRVTLGDLPKGNYRIVSYHIDANEPSGFQQCEEILVYVTDENGSAVLQNLSGDADDTTRSFNNLTDQSIRATASAFEINSDGSNDIIIYFDGTAAVDTEVPLNGLLIEKIIDTSLPPVYPKGTIIIIQ